MSCEKPEQKEHRRKKRLYVSNKSLCCAAEAGTTLEITYTPTSKIKFTMIFNKKVVKDHDCNSLLKKSMKPFLVSSHVWTEFIL